MFALLLLLAKRFQPLDKNSKHEAWLNRVFSVVITLVAAGGVAVSSCGVCIMFVACRAVPPVDEYQSTASNIHFRPTSN